ncbi:MAG TPA: YkvA family protein [Micromonosporaceae bacterium]|nr:YkvA family protein [Micromonosporaceae bacterium]
MSREAWILLGVVGAIVALVTLAGAIWLATRLVRTKRMLAQVGGGGKVAFYAALIYTIFPIDILPDPIYLDDMAVLGGALFYLTKLLRARAAAKAAVPGPRPPAPTSPVRRR